MNVANFETANAVLNKSIITINEILKQLEKPFRLSSDLDYYEIRIAKKNSGKHSDFPCKNIINKLLVLDKYIRIADVNFENFFIDYKTQAITNLTSCSSKYLMVE